MPASVERGETEANGPTAKPAGYSILSSLKQGRWAWRSGSLPCSRNARPQKALVGRAHSKRARSAAQRREEGKRWCNY